MTTSNKNQQLTAVGLALLATAALTPEALGPPVPVAAPPGVLTSPRYLPLMNCESQVISLAWTLSYSTVSGASAGHVCDHDAVAGTA